MNFNCILQQDSFREYISKRNVGNMWQVMQAVIPRKFGILKWHVIKCMLREVILISHNRLQAFWKANVRKWILPEVISILDTNMCWLVFGDDEQDMKFNIQCNTNKQHEKTRRTREALWRGHSVCEIQHKPESYSYRLKTWRSMRTFHLVFTLACHEYNISYVN